MQLPKCRLQTVDLSLLALCSWGGGGSSSRPDVALPDTVAEIARVAARGLQVAVVSGSRMSCCTRVKYGACKDSVIVKFQAWRNSCLKATGPHCIAFIRIPDK